VARFIGRHEHSLDNKGRVILPARFRSSFDTHAFISQHHDKCLALWTPDEFEKQLEEMETTQTLGPRERNTVRVWASGSVEVEMDRNGRVAIPQYLRAFAGLEEMKPVLVTGALNRIELWNPQEWAARVMPSEASFTTSETDPEVASV
jgi:MraZ protein